MSTTAWRSLIIKRMTGNGSQTTLSPIQIRVFDKGTLQRQEQSTAPCSPLEKNDSIEASYVEGYRSPLKHIAILEDLNLKSG